MRVGVKRTRAETAEVPKTASRATQTTSEAITEVQSGTSATTTTTVTRAGAITIIHPPNPSSIKKCKVEIVEDPDTSTTKMVRVEENIKLFDVGRAMYQTQVMSLCNFIWAIISHANLLLKEQMCSLSKEKQVKAFKVLTKFSIPNMRILRVS